MPKPSNPQEVMLQLRSAIAQRMGVPMHKATSASTGGVMVETLADIPTNPGFLFSEEQMSSMNEEIMTMQNSLLEGQNLEVEMSLGHFTNKRVGNEVRRSFRPGFSNKQLFEKMKQVVFVFAYQKMDSLEFEEEVTSVDIINDEDMRRITLFREDYHPKYTIERKTRRVIGSSEPFGVRVSASIEEDVTTPANVKSFNEKWERKMQEFNDAAGRRVYNRKPLLVTRMRKRERWVEWDDYDDEYIFSFDLTEITETLYLSNGTMNTSSRYEVEFEIGPDAIVDGRVIGWDDISLGPPAQFLNQIGNILLRVYALENPIEDEGKRIMRNVNDLTTVEQRLSFVDFHNSIFEDSYSVKGQRRDDLRLNSGYDAKPTNMKLDHFFGVDTKRMRDFDTDYYVTIKLDGVRRFIAIDNNGSMWMYWPPHQAWKINQYSIEDLRNEGIQTPLILDGEYIDRLEDYYAFDCLVSGQQDLRNAPFEQRIAVCDQSVKSIAKLRGEMDRRPRIISKLDFFTYHTGDIYADINTAMTEIQEFKQMNPDHLKDDGLILQSTGSYNDGLTRKLKPPKDMTIDFKYVNTGRTTQVRRGGKQITLAIFELHVSVGRKTKQFKVRRKVKGQVKFEGAVVFVEESDVDEYNDNVVESKWDFKIQRFIPVRVRDDKEYPNNIKTALDVWSDIIRPLNKATITGKNLRLARRFNNIVKNNIIRNTIEDGDVVLDIGIGRFAEQDKYIEAGVSRVIGIEPDTNNISELRRRDKGKIPIDIANIGAQETRKFVSFVEDLEGVDLEDINVVVSNFSLTFFFGDEQSIEGLMNTLAQMPVGCRFIGTMQDGEQTFNYLQRIEGGEPEPESFSIKPKGGLNGFTRSFGDEVVVNINEKSAIVKNQTEWLVYFNILQEKLESIGYRLVEDRGEFGSGSTLFNEFESVPMIREYKGDEGFGPSRTYNITLKEPHFSDIARGRKTIEIRLNKGVFSKIRGGDVLVFENSDNTLGVTNKVTVTVTRRDDYSTFADALKVEGLSKTLPHVHSISDALKNVYHRYYDKVKRNNHTVVAFEVEVKDIDYGEEGIQEEVFDVTDPNHPDRLIIDGIRYGVSMKIQEDEFWGNETLELIERASVSLNKESFDAVVSELPEKHRQRIENIIDVSKRFQPSVVRNSMRGYKQNIIKEREMRIDTLVLKEYNESVAVGSGGESGGVQQTNYQTVNFRFDKMNDESRLWSSMQRMFSFVKVEDVEREVVDTKFKFKQPKKPNKPKQKPKKPKQPKKPNQPKQRSTQIKSIDEFLKEEYPKKKSATIKILKEYAKKYNLDLKDEDGKKLKSTARKAELAAAVERAYNLRSGDVIDDEEEDDEEEEVIVVEEEEDEGEESDVEEDDEQIRMMREMGLI